MVDLSAGTPSYCTQGSGVKSLRIVVVRMIEKRALLLPLDSSPQCLVVLLDQQARFGHDEIDVEHFL